jgi:hypothetical protein
MCLEFRRASTRLDFETSKSIGIRYPFLVRNAVNASVYSTVLFVLVPVYSVLILYTLAALDENYSTSISEDEPRKSSRNYILNRYDVLQFYKGNGHRIPCRWHSK